MKSPKRHGTNAISQSKNQRFMKMENGDEYCPRCESC